MSRLNHDTLSLIFQEVAAYDTIHQLRFVAGVCRTWASAAVPFLYRKIVIRFSWGEAGKLEKLEAFLRQSSPYKGFVRELEIRGDRHELLERYSPILIASLKTLKALTHVSWCFADNIPSRLLESLNDHGNLLSLHVQFYPPPQPSGNCFGSLRSANKTLSLMMCGNEHLPTAARREPPSMKKYLCDASYCFKSGPDRVGEKNTLARQKVAFQTPPGLHGPIMKTIMMVVHNVNLWRNHDPSKVFDVRNVRRLILAGCRDPIFVPWQAYPPGLEVLKILDPVPSYPIGAGLYLGERQIARPLSHFTRLNVLDLQNVGAPICEVLFHLQESGTSLKVLNLHDQEISGIDMCYKVRRQQPGTTDIACFFLKLLAYLCPNLHTLSLDISSHGLEQDHPTVHHQRSDSYSATLDPMLEEVARYPTLSLSETFRSLRDLQFLRLVTPFSPAMCNSQNALRYAGRLWSKSLNSFTLVASAFAGAKCVGSLDARGDYKLIPGSQSEWRVKSTGSNDTTGHENNCLYLLEDF